MNMFTRLETAAFYLGKEVCSNSSEAWCVIQFGEFVMLELLPLRPNRRTCYAVLAYTFLLEF